MAFENRDSEIADATEDGYRGIWFGLGQLEGQYGDKYSGGLGTYTSKHVPMAIYAPEVETTFFTYGGTARGDRDLRIMVSAYDHAAHEVPRPTVVDYKREVDDGYDADTVVDPHDNAALALDDDGHVWVFVAGRGRRRPGRIYRSVEPYSVAAFERVREQSLMAYPQPWHLDDSVLLCFTIYDEAGNRDLYWQTSPDGFEWSDPRELAGFGGHYQVSECHEDTVYTAFNWHPGPDGHVDGRTNVYVVCTRDGGDTWETIDGESIETPLSSPENAALAAEFASRDRNVYLSDLSVDGNGNPLVLAVTSGGHEPGPENGPRRWVLVRWTGERWRTDRITESDHNYDSGSLYVRGEDLFVVGPTEEGPQRYHTGGRMAVWRSADGGASWEREHVFPTQDGYNATYARRPRDATAPFEVFWADGDASACSESRLYVATLDGSGYWQLPYDMAGETAEPRSITR